MAYISRYDKKFLTFMNKKYDKYNILFEYYDDYILWLFYEYCKGDEDIYYSQLEDDLRDYVEFQSGKERDKRDKLIEGRII